MMRYVIDIVTQICHNFNKKMKIENPFRSILYQVSLKSRHWKWLLFIAREGEETCMRRNSIRCRIWHASGVEEKMLFQEPWEPEMPLVFC